MQLITELERANDLIHLHTDGVQWKNEDAERVYVAGRSDNHFIRVELFVDEDSILDWYRRDIGFINGFEYQAEKGIAARNKYHQSELYQPIL